MKEIQIIDIKSAEYPAKLRDIPNPPKRLRKSSPERIREIQRAMPGETLQNTVTLIQPYSLDIQKKKLTAKSCM